MRECTKRVERDKSLRMSYGEALSKNLLIKTTKKVIFKPYRHLFIGTLGNMFKPNPKFKNAQKSKMPKKPNHITISGKKIIRQEGIKSAPLTK